MSERIRERERERRKGRRESKRRLDVSKRRVVHGVGTRHKGGVEVGRWGKRMGRQGGGVCC